MAELYISAADRAELAQKVRDELGLEIGPDRLDPALRRPNLVVAKLPIGIGREIYACREGVVE